MKKQNPKTVVCFGEVLWDMLPGGAKPGGAPMNVALHLKRHELDPMVVSRLGNDGNGQKLHNFFEESRLNPKYLQTDEELPTSQVLVRIDSEKNASYEICEPVAWDNIRFSHGLQKLAENTQLVVFGTLAMRNKTTRQTFLKFLGYSPAKRFLDVNLRPPYDNREVVEEMLLLSDFAKLNSDELATIAGWNGKTGSDKEIIMWFSERYHIDAVCVTRGADGAVLFMQDEWFEHPGFNVQVADTVGAGDAFFAGLIAQLFAGNSPEKALEIACATGAFVASRPGAVPEYSNAEIMGFLK